MPNRLQRFLILAVVVAGLLPAVSRAEIVDRVVAVVNNNVITLYDLNQQGAELFRRIRQEVPADQQAAALQRARQELLSALIDQQLIEQRAEKEGITVSKKELRTALKRILTRAGLDRQQFLQELKANGTSEAAYRERLRTQILQSKLIGLEVRSRIVVTDKKIKEYYDRHFATQKGDGYHILQIGFSWNKDGGSPTREEARKRAEEVRKKAVAGGDFQRLAMTYSDLPSAADGGDIGVFKKTEMAPYMRKVITSMQPGGISPVVTTKSGFQFFKLLSVKNGDVVREASFKNMKNEIRDKVYQEEAQAQYKNWLKELRAEAYIKKLL